MDRLNKIAAALYWTAVGAAVAGLFRVGLHGGFETGVLVAAMMFGFSGGMRRLQSMETK